MARESSARTRLLELFDNPILTQYAELGRFLSDEIRAAADGAPVEVEDRMRRCVARLELPPEAVIVTVPPFPS